MSYPMTWRRIVGRSGLGKGDYNDAGDHKNMLNLDQPGIRPGMSEEERLKDFYGRMGPGYVSAIKSNEEQWRMLLGDIRRLEADVADEKAICQHIASRVGVDPDVVAAVLKEFLSF